jgi:hypothetical protein
MSKDVDWSKFKARCSGIHALLAESRDNPCLTEKQAARLSELENKDTLTDKMQIEMAELLVKKDNSTKIVLSSTCQDYLIDEWAWKKEGMVRVTREILDVPQMQKGIFVEPDSLILLSQVDQVIYNPNVMDDLTKERVYNDYLSGEVDAYAGESIMTATAIPDVKSIWDRPTFLSKIKTPLSKANDFQIKGYMDITGAKTGFIADCLINTPPHVVEAVKWSLLRKMNVASEESPEFLEKWAVVCRSMNFDHIPNNQKVSKMALEV